MYLIVVKMQGKYIVSLILFSIILICHCQSYSRVQKAEDKREKIVRLADELVGNKYRYGGKDKQGFDCSGLVYYVMGNHQIKMNASSSTQAKQGKQIKMVDSQPGDLIFFKRKNESSIFHVAIISEVNEDDIWITHSTSSKGVIKQNLNQSKYWKEKIHLLKNVID